MLKDVLRLIRIGNCLIALLAVLIGFWIEAGIFWEYGLIGGIVAFGICACGNIANNIADWKRDSKEKNPISSGKISLENAWKLFFILSFISLGLSLVLGFWGSVLAIGIYLLMIIYAFIMKELKWLGNFAVALGTGLTFLFGGIIAGNIGIVLYASTSAFLVNVGREIAKDLEDYERDKEEKKGFPSVIGKKWAGVIGGAFVLAGFPFAIYLYSVFSLYYLILTSLSFLIFIFGIKKLLSGKYSNAQEIYKKGMIVYMIALIIGGLL